MRRLTIILGMLFLPALVQAQTHPSVLLTPTVLSALSAKVVANDPTWVTLKATCDRYLSGAVYPPDHSGVASPNIASGYAGADYRTFAIDYGLCYQALLQTDPTAALPYGNKLVSLILAISDPAHQWVAGTFVDPVEKDSGYALRMYVPALAYGFDWTYSLLTSGQKTQVINQINKFVDFWRIGPYPVVISGGAITSVTVYEHGLVWAAAAPTVTVHKSAGVPGTGATFGTPVLDANKNISSIPVTAGGSGYDASNPPEIFLNGVSRSTFLVSHPESNYYIGYYIAECLAALATPIDNPNAATYWTDWSVRVHGQGVGAWEGTYLKGGGWTEGFMNYGPLVVRSALLATMLVKDVKGIDYTTTGTPNFTWPTDTIDYAIYGSQPSLATFMGEGSTYCKSPGCGLNINAEMNVSHPDFFRVISWYGKYWSHPHAAMVHKFSKDVLTATTARYPSLNLGNMMPDHDWEDFIFWYPNDPDADYTTLPLSYKASGQQQVFARSDWSTSALWMMFNNSPFIEYPGQGEQEFGTGQMEVVNGSTPLIVLPMSWTMHLPDGDAGKTRGICDEVGGCAVDPAHNVIAGRPRRWYNTFQISTWDHSQPDLNQATFPPALPPLPASGISPITTLNSGGSIGGTNNISTTYEDVSSYVFSSGAHLESMMRPWAAGTLSPISSWTRQQLYLRPSNQILVYDRTIVRQTNNWDQVLAFHTPANPSIIAQNPTVSGATREDVTFNSNFAGSIISVLPANAAVTHWDLDNGNTAWRTEIRNTTCTATACPTPAPTTQQWLTVLDANTSSGSVWNASGITSAGMTGALLQNPAGTANSIALFNVGAAGTTVSFASPQTYTIPLSVASSHTLTEVPASTVHKVSYNSGTGVVTVANSGGSGTSVTSTTAGALSFTIDITGVVNGSATLPVLSHSPTALTFPNQLINTPSSGLVITLTNTGNATLTTAGISMQSGAQFSQVNTCSGSLAPGDNCAVTVTFTPTSIGNKTDNIVVTTNAASSPDLIAVSGTGVLSAIGTNSIGVTSSPGVRIQ